jgi:hypothetical protein
MCDLATLLLFMTVARLRAIEDVDFANFTYPSFAGLPSVPARDGDYCSPPDRDVCVTVGAPAYGDLTGDGVSEAVISLGAVFRTGNGSHTAGFVYTLVDGQPRLIGRFAGGDRGSGGILDVAIRKQRLIVLRMQASCASCTDATEEDTFRWNGRRLVLVSSGIRRSTR